MRIFRYGKDSAPYDGPRTAGRKHYEHPNPALLLDSVMQPLSVCVFVFRGDLRDYEEADWSRLDAPEDQR